MVGDGQQFKRFYDRRRLDEDMLKISSSSVIRLEQLTINS